jgi:gamma-glutamyltranspeptidase / glutathione hydrolase
VEESAPLRCRYRDYEISSAPPPSSGGATLCEILNIIEPFPLASWGWHSARSLHYIAEAERRARSDGETTHYPIVDRRGNAVAVSYTLNDWFGARVIAGKTGFFLDDEMDDFTAKPGVPNMYGLVQGERNDVQPRKRPLSSMAPTMSPRTASSRWSREAQAARASSPSCSKRCSALWSTA